VTAIANEKGGVVCDRSSSTNAIKVFVAVHFAGVGFVRPLSSSIPLWLDDASRGARARVSMGEGRSRAKMGPGQGVGQVISDARYIYMAWQSSMQA
jgi:hypothetical protein